MRDQYRIRERDTSCPAIHSSTSDTSPYPSRGWDQHDICFRHCSGRLSGSTSGWPNRTESKVRMVKSPLSWSPLPSYNFFTSDKRATAANQAAEQYREWMKSFLQNKKDEDCFELCSQLELVSDCLMSKRGSTDLAALEKAEAIGYMYMALDQMRNHLWLSLLVGMALEDLQMIWSLLKARLSSERLLIRRSQGGLRVGKPALAGQHQKGKAFQPPSLPNFSPPPSLGIHSRIRPTKDWDHGKPRQCWWNNLMSFDLRTSKSAPNQLKTTPAPATSSTT